MQTKEILENLRKQQKTRKPSCTPCNIAISDISTHFNDLIEHVDIVRNMYANRLYKVRLKDGITYTIDDIEHNIYVDKCWIKENLDRYQKCCKEGKLSDIEKFKC